MEGGKRAVQEGRDMHIHIADSCLPGSPAGKEATCNAGDPSLIPGSERSSGEGIGYQLWYSWTSLVAQMIKNLPACNAGDLGSIPGLGRSPRGGHGNLLQDSCLENPHEQRSLVHGVAKSQT